MPTLYTLAAGAALTFAVCGVTLAYSGDFDLGSPAPPVMMQFDAGHTSTAAPTTSTTPSRSATTDDEASQPVPPKYVGPKPARDEFQRYFDRHYRAHLVLDAAAHRLFEVE